MTYAYTFQPPPCFRGPTADAVSAGPALMQLSKRVVQAPWRDHMSAQNSLTSRGPMVPNTECSVHSATWKTKIHKKKNKINLEHSDGANHHCRSLLSFSVAFRGDSILVGDEVRMTLVWNFDSARSLATGEALLRLPLFSRGKLRKIRILLTNYSIHRIDLCMVG